MRGHHRRGQGRIPPRTRWRPALYPAEGVAALMNCRPKTQFHLLLNYGVHWMLNLLVKGGDRSGLILIRALEPRRGLSAMRARRGVEELRRLCSGPGKLAQALDITKRHHEMSICSGSRHCLLPPSESEIAVVSDPRIGISRSKDLPWRFTLAGSPFVSVPVRPGPR